MIILAIRTDRSDAEISLMDNYKLINQIKWTAHRMLADTIHIKIDQLLKEKQIKFKELQGIVCFRGPGSFTGLRIGLTVANTFAHSYDLPIVTSNGQNWQAEGVAKLLGGINDKIALPEYGSDAKTTKPKK